MMYTQQVAHLPPGVASEKDLADQIEKKLDPTRYAVILHDQDTDENCQPVAPHIHAMLCFDNARHITSIAKKLGDKPQYIEKWDGQAGNGFAYLVHRTKKARASGKYLYDYGAVIANFDFECLVKTMSARSVADHARGNASDIEGLLDLLYVGGISKKELESQLSGSQYARYRRQIEDVDAKRLLNEAEKWRKEMWERKVQIKVIWIFGQAGTGKTSLAKEYAEKAGQEYYISGSTRDLFQNYRGQHTVILDELCPIAIEYCDLLRITDPFGIGNQVMAPARYSDKALACDLIIITSPYNPRLFYEHSKVDREDNFDQLDRRIALTIHMTSNEINAMKWNGMAYFCIPGKQRNNPYSQAARSASSVISSDLFDSMFD